jgi:hypothetical protein
MRELIKYVIIFPLGKSLHYIRVFGRIKFCFKKGDEGGSLSSTKVQWRVSERKNADY